MAKDLFTSDESDIHISAGKQGAEVVTPIKHKHKKKPVKHIGDAADTSTKKRINVSAIGRRAEAENRKRLNKELAKRVDALNKSLKRLEEAGMADKSKFYSDAQAALKRGVPYLHTNAKGQMRFTSAYLKSTDIENRTALLNKLTDFYENYKTRTIKGIKEQAKKKLQTIEKEMPSLKGKLKSTDVDNINEIFKRLREQGFLDHYGSSDAWENVDKLKDKSIQDIENALNELTSKEAATDRGRIANSDALDILIGSTGQYLKNH